MRAVIPCAGLEVAQPNFLCFFIPNTHPSKLDTGHYGCAKPKLNFDGCHVILHPYELANWLRHAHKTQLAIIVLQCQSRIGELVYGRRRSCKHKGQNSLRLKYRVNFSQEIEG